MTTKSKQSPHSDSDEEGYEKIKQIYEIADAFLNSIRRSENELENGRYAMAKVSEIWGIAMEATHSLAAKRVALTAEGDSNETPE